MVAITEPGMLGNAPAWGKGTYCLHCRCFWAEGKTIPPPQRRPDEPYRQPRPLVLGLDLGQQQDYSALAVAEQVEAEEEREYHIRHLHRWPLGTPYTTPEGEAPGIIEDVYDLVGKAPGEVILVLDATGCGMPVVDMVRRYRLPVRRLAPIVITAGQSATMQKGTYHVPKRDLATNLASLMESRRLQIAPALRLATTLQQELATFKVKTNVLTGHESFEAWRERDHDDLVLAVALACWYAERGQRRLNVFC
jgi:hypothetical protein